jgi:hypothetical protein
MVASFFSLSPSDGERGRGEGFDRFFGTLLAKKC